MVPVAVFVIVIVFVAAVAQATTGFGYALIAVPLLTLATDPRTAVVGAAISSMLLTVVLAVRERRFVRWSVTGWLLAASMLGLPFGLLILRHLPDRWLTAVIALTSLAGTLVVWRRVRLDPGRVTVGAVGVLTGVLSTATGTNGPPLVAAFQAMGYDANTLRATISAVFTGTGFFGLIGFFVTGEVTASAAAVGLVGIPATALGWLVGDRVFARLNDELFRKVVLVGLVVISVVTLVDAAW